MAGRAAALTILALACALPACGRKTLPRPPQLVAPRAVQELSLATQSDGILVRWSRPTEYVDGSEMEDLGGFVVERNRYNSDFEEVARVPVTDRGRFQKAKRFDYVDTRLLSGATYHYRIVAYTTDGYYSVPSGAAEITWSPPGSTPADAPTPAAEP
ncbi:MAG: fibronectin type III domain-containing protein [Deltaproteobacteria bacterium]|nr:fibronectin type III domain-containing protein [Deltaproteobacteria bacterium]